MENPNTSLGAAVCRICMCGETSIPYHGKQAGEPLISPCRCSGTMGLYHRSCLEHWLTLSKTKDCEICKFSFKIAQKSRNFADYIRQRGYEKQQNDTENRNPFVDIAFIIIVTPLACVAFYMCIRGAALAGQKYHFAFENRENDENGRNLEIRNETSMEFALFVFVAVVLFFAFTIFLIVLLTNHISQFRAWQAKNMILFVVDQLDAEQSMHYNPQCKKHHLGWKEKLTRTLIPIESIFEISPVLVANFNQTSADSDNTHNHDASRNAIPFDVRSPDQLYIGMHSTPQMYSEEPRKWALSPIGLDDLFAATSSPSLSREPSISPERMEMKKTQSVYSVCSSFGNGVVKCSTPVADRNLRVNMISPNPSSISTFKAGPTSSNSNLLNNGRFHVERLDTPLL
uniref:RING-CH-type domain-containing protein n=1 Tax=Caenorhabditis japonica TaxID=281687 RepID=A0A8R1DV61_CAEJA